jgi:tetratricopeptide (TPR) repeat protein
MKVRFGEHEIAIEHVARAMRLSPLEPRSWSWRFFTALAHFFAGRYSEAASWPEKALRDQPNHAGIMRTLAASYALVGRMDEAERTMKQLASAQPHAACFQSQGCDTSTSSAGGPREIRRGPSQNWAAGTISMAARAEVIE